MVLGVTRNLRTARSSHDRFRRSLMDRSMFVLWGRYKLINVP
jgi:hypothetical protein